MGNIWGEGWGRWRERDGEDGESRRARDWSEMKGERGRWTERDGEDKRSGRERDCEEGGRERDVKTEGWGRWREGEGGGRGIPTRSLTSKLHRGLLTDDGAVLVGGDARVLPQVLVPGRVSDDQVTSHHAVVVIRPDVDVDSVQHPSGEIK